MKKSIKYLFLFVFCFIFIFALSACSNSDNSLSLSSSSSKPNLPTAVSISVRNQKESFFAGEEFSMGDIIVEATLSDGSVKTLTKEEYAVNSSDCDLENAGEYTVKITYSGLETSYTITVKSDPIQTILITANKTEYAYGEDFYCDIIVTGKTQNNRTVTLNNGDYVVDFSAYDKNTAGTYTIKVSVGEIYDTYQVKVKTSTIKSGIRFLAGKTVFEFEETFDYSALRVNAIYTDGREEAISPSDFSVDFSEYVYNKTGQYDIKISAFGFNTTYKVTVKRMNKFNVLMIGNSFSEDTVQWVYKIAADLNIENVNVCNMYIGGCNLDTHYNNAINNSPDYDFQTYVNGEWTHNTGKILEYGITYYDWDYISLQQSSGVTGIASSFSKLQPLMDYVKQKATNKNFKFLWNMTWAFSSDSTHSAFVNYNYDQETMYNAIVKCVKSEILTKDFYKVIPSGTVMQNVRSSFIGDNVTRDGYHLSYDLGRYCAGLNLVYTLSGLDISSLNYAPSGVPESYKKVAIESVVNAGMTPYAVTKSAYITEPELISEKEIAEKNLMKLDYLPIASAYYNATNSENYNKLITGASNCPSFVATAKRFTKQELPVGSIILLKRGWQYRPEAWTDDVVQTSRPAITTSARIDVDEAWWGNYKYRAFNISKVGTSSLNGRYIDAVDAFQIYVPKETPVTSLPSTTETDKTILSNNGKNIDEMKRFNFTPVIGFYNCTLTTTPEIQITHEWNNRFVSSDALTKTQLPVGSVIIIDKGWQCRPDGWVGTQKTTSRPEIVYARTNATVISVTDEWWSDFTIRALIIAQIGNPNPDLNENPYSALEHVRIYVPNI